MKNSMRLISVVTAIVLIVITCYQSYWLVDIYNSLHARLLTDIQESVRASDFEEIVHRVNVMRTEHVGGKMQISVGVDKNHDRTVLKNVHSESLDNEKTENNLNSHLPNEDFSNALRNSDDVVNVGLSMQRGIHSGLDKMRPIDIVYYDSLLSRRLDSLGVRNAHQTLLLQNVTLNGKQKSKTLASVGVKCEAPADTFNLGLDYVTDTQYRVIVPISTMTILAKMKSPILFSAVTLLMLILAFAYIINQIRTLKALDDMKSDFTNNITHELKTPISVAYAANDALLNFNDLSDTDKVRKYLTICQEQLSKLAELVEQILSLTMEQRKNMLINMESVEVLPIVEKVANNHTLKSDKKVLFSVNIPETFTVYADKTHLSNIINNLIDNAIKYSDNEVSIVIDARTDVDGGKLISIKDNGIGMSRESMKYVFDKFYRVPNGNIHNVKGHGLGLFYVESMMKKFNGHVAVQSELGEGSTFRLRFNG